MYDRGNIVFGGRGMKRWRIVAAAAAASLGLMLHGCQGFAKGGGEYQPESSGIYVTRDGVILSATVETYDSGAYTSEALLDFVKKEVAAYNESQGAGAAAENPKEGSPLPVAVVSGQAAEGRLVVVYQYGDAGSFQKFAQEYHDVANQAKSFQVQTAAVGKAAGWFSEGEFVKIGKDGATAAGEGDLEKLDKEQVILVEADHPMKIQTEGKILYTTRDIALSGTSQATVPEGKHCIVFR